MHTDFNKASAFENLVMYTEGNQTHVTNDVEAVKKLLKRESDSVAVARIYGNPPMISLK